MSTPTKFRSAFVPHDLSAPIAGAAKGPLAGLTVGIKDMYDVAGSTTGGGSPVWLDKHAPAKRHAAPVRKFLAAGATVIGKTVRDEFFFSLTGANAHYGTPLNPRAPGRLPGGSSAGSASATAAGACDFALGSDTGGSVRVPASFCGIYGIRVTLGRVDMTGAMDMAPSFDAAGWLAQGPGVFRRVGKVLLEGPRKLAAVRELLVLDDAFAEADADVVRLLQAALRAMAADLPKPTNIAAAPEGLDTWREVFRVMQAHEVWQTYGEFVTANRPRLGPGIWERMQFAAVVTKDEYADAAKQRTRIRTHARKLAQPGTVLALPSAPCIALPLETSAEDLEVFRKRAMRLTCIAGLNGLPQVSIPVGTVAGCPVGLSFIGWAGGDEALLDLAVKLGKYVGAAGP
jgi:amidase